MPSISRTFILSTSPKALPTLPIPLQRRSLSASPSLLADSQHHRSDFSGQGYVSSYDPYEPPKGPLAQSSRHGTVRLSPKTLKEYLDKFVIGQDKAKKVTSVAIFNHYQRIREIRRLQLEEQANLEMRMRREQRERADNSHPVENEYPGHVETVDLNRMPDPEPDPEPEPEIGSRLPEDDIPETIIEKSNLLLLGPSGVGKTYILQTLARVLEVPFATVDCSSLTQAGYIGSDIESSIERLLLAASYSISKCETGIVFFDEIDKLAKPAVMTHGRDVSGEGVQQGLLKMIEGTNVTVNAKQDRNNRSEPSTSRGDRGGREPSPQQGKGEQFTIDTTNILFVFAGAFVGLEKIISKRLSSGSSIGFGAPIRPPSKNPDHKSPSNSLQHVNTSDLQTYGLIPELLGRIPITVSLSPLSLDQLVSILKDPKNSLVNQYAALFATYSVNLRFTTAALHAIAQQTLTSTSSLSPNAGDKSVPTPGMGVGARGLRTVMESVLQETMYIAPGSDVRFCLIDEDFVKCHFEDKKKEAEGRGPSASSLSESGKLAERDWRAAKSDKNNAVKLPLWWSRGSSAAFEAAYEREEREWDERVNGNADEENRGAFEQLRVGGSSGM